MTDFLPRIPTSMAKWTRRLGIAAVVGVLAGLATAMLEFALHEGSALLVGRFTDLGQADVLQFRLGILLLPALGGLASGLILFWLCPRLGGHGTDLLIRAFHRHAGAMPLRGPSVNAVAAVGVISCGGSAGPEGPVAALGAAIGSVLGGVFSVTPRERRVLLISGCGAGVGAIFQCPLGGALFAVSVLYREPDYETDAILPAFVASVVGYSVYMPFWGHGVHLLQGADTLVFSSPRELIPFALLGPLCGFLCIVFHVCMRFVEHMTAEAPRLPRWLLPALGGLATGAIACVLPQVMDGQYVFIQKAMDGSFVGGLGERSWWMWAVLFGVVMIAKCMATGLTIGSGAPGGVLGPSVFIGGAAGAFLGAVISAIAPDLFTSDPENLRRALIPVGMAGVLSASMRTPLAALVMVTEMTGSYGLIVPLMVVSVSSYVVGRRWGLNNEQVRSSPESPAHAGDVIVHLLETGRVKEVMRRDRHGFVRPDTTLRELVPQLEPGSQPALAVVENGQVKGIIAAPEITQIMSQPDISEVIIAADMMTPDPTVLRPDESLYSALAAMARKNDLVLPVVSNDKRGQFLGMLTRSDIYEAVRIRLDDLRKHLVQEHGALASIGHEDTVHQLALGVPAAKATRIQRLLVPLQVVGQSLRDADFRGRFGFQVIAIEQADGSIQCPPDVTAPLRTDQRLLAVGSPDRAENENGLFSRPINGVDAT